MYFSADRLPRLNTTFVYDKDYLDISFLFLRTGHERLSCFPCSDSLALERSLLCRIYFDVVIYTYFYSVDHYPPFEYHI